MNQLFKNALSLSERTTQRILTTAIQDSANPFFGKPTSVDGLYEPFAALVWISEMAAVYITEESVYYKNEEVLDKLQDLCAGADSVIHEDGTDDLRISNFRQPEYFQFPLVCQAYRQFAKLENPTEKEIAATETLYHLVERLAQGLLASGFHTPNHRWCDVP